MPVKLNEDGTVDCIPPWTLEELLEVTGYEFTQKDGVFVVYTHR